MIEMVGPIKKSTKTYKERQSELKRKVESGEIKYRGAEGMPFESVRSKLLKFKSVTKNPEMAKSLLRQCEIKEGVDARNNLADEFVAKRIDTNDHSTNRVGYSPQYAESWLRVYGK